MNWHTAYNRAYMRRRFAPWPSVHSAFAERHICPERYVPFALKGGHKHEHKS